MLSLLAALPAAALADPTARGYEPNPNHLSVVVTTDLVYITWTDPAGLVPTKVSAYRGDGSACPTGPTDGTPIAVPSVTNHLIDPSVTAGSSYCYTVLVADAAGTQVKIGSTGTVPVPDLTAPPPTSAPASTPLPQAPSSNGLDAARVKAIVASAGALLALALLAVILRTHRRSRTADAGPAFESELRLSFTGLSASALIIPAAIALAWVLVVTAVVVFR